MRLNQRFNEQPKIKACYKLDKPSSPESAQEGVRKSRAAEENPLRPEAYGRENGPIILGERKNIIPRVDAAILMAYYNKRP